MTSKERVKEKRMRDWESASDYYASLRFLLTSFQHHVSHRTYVHSPSFLPILNLILIPEAFRWQTMTDNMRQPQLTRDTERINASDQSGYSYNLLSALDPDERAQNIVTSSSLFDLNVKVKHINSPCTFRMSLSECLLSERLLSERLLSELCYSPVLT